MLKYTLKRYVKRILPQKIFNKYYNFKYKNLESKANKIKLIMVLLCKDEDDIVEDWLLFHKAMGVDGFIVTDNNSSDDTRKIL